MSKNSVAAIVVAAGRSRRMGRLGDKIWIKIAGRPILFYSLRAFLRAGIRNVVVVVRSGDVARVRSRLARHFPRTKLNLAVVVGGRERQDSVWNGIRAAASDIVLVHDAARPNVSPDLIRAVCREAVRSGGCVPAVPVIDTLKQISNRRVVRTETRAGLYGVQTPQGFRREVLLRAIVSARKKGRVGTDCASLVEWTGKKVAATAGDPANLKLTRPEDVGIFKKLLKPSTR